MKVFVLETRKVVTFRIYGLNGEECAKTYFDKYFTQMEEIYRTTEEEQSIYGIDADYTVVHQSAYKWLAGFIGVLQDVIDTVVDEMIEGKTKEEYTIDGVFYAI